MDRRLDREALRFSFLRIYTFSGQTMNESRIYSRSWSARFVRRLLILILSFYKAPFHGEHVVGHLLASSKHREACLETATRSIERETLTMGVEAEIEVAVLRGVRTGKEFAVDEGHTRGDVATALQVGQGVGEQKADHAMIVFLRIAQHDASLFDKATAYSGGADNVFSVFGGRNEESLYV